MSLGRYRPWGQSQEKIRPEHQDRAAVVYVRQSSRQQVLEHSESTRLQYALAERAVALGWARSQVVVIDIGNQRYQNLLNARRDTWAA